MPSDAIAIMDQSVQLERTYPSVKSEELPFPYQLHQELVKRVSPEKKTAEVRRRL